MILLHLSDAYVLEISNSNLGPESLNQCTDDSVVYWTLISRFVIIIEYCRWDEDIVWALNIPENINSTLAKPNMISNDKDINKILIKFLLFIVNTITSR